MNFIQFEGRALKNVVHHEISIKTENMRRRITAACVGISPEVIGHTDDSAIKRLQPCIDTNNQHTLNILCNKKISFITVFKLE